MAARMPTSKNGKSQGGNPGRGRYRRGAGYVAAKSTPPNGWRILDAGEMKEGKPGTFHSVPEDILDRAKMQVGGSFPPYIDEDTRKQMVERGCVVTKSGLTYSKERDGHLVRVPNTDANFSTYLVTGARQCQHERQGDKSQVFYAKRVIEVKVQKGLVVSFKEDPSDNTVYNIMKIGTYNGLPFFNIHAGMIVRAKIHKAHARYTVLTSVMGITNSYVNSVHGGNSLDLYDVDFVKGVLGERFETTKGKWLQTSIQGNVTNLVGSRGEFHCIAPDLFCRFVATTNHLLPHEESFQPGSPFVLCYKVSDDGIQLAIKPLRKETRPAYATTFIADGSDDVAADGEDFTLP